MNTSEINKLFRTSVDHIFELCGFIGVKIDQIDFKHKYEQTLQLCDTKHGNAIIYAQIGSRFLIEINVFRPLRITSAKSDTKQLQVT